MSEEDDALSPEELFRNAVGDVRPVRNHRHQEKTPPPAPVPRQSEQDERNVLKDMLSDAFFSEEVQPGEVISHMTPGIQQRVFRKLRKGEYRREAEIDLHGMTADIARGALNGFIADCFHSDYRCVQIIHGKGYGSKGEGPVLKSRVNTWLRQHNKILAFHSATPRDGGTGAVYVLLKANRKD